MRASSGIALYFLATSTGVAYILLANGLSPWTLNNRHGKEFNVWSELAAVFARSELAFFIVINWLFAAMSTFVLLTTMLFLGHLSARESALLFDRLVKFCAFKLMFVSAMRLPPTLEESLDWLAWFAVAGFLRIFIGMARDRLEGLVAAPSAPVSAHVRAVTLVLIILAKDCMAIRELWGAAGVGSVLSALGISGVSEFASMVGGEKVKIIAAATAARNVTHNVSRIALCAYDLAIIFLEGAKALLKYGIHLADMWAAHRATTSIHAGGEADESSFAHMDSLRHWAPWEGKGGVLFHIELVTDVLMHSTTIAHYLHMWALHGCTLHVVDMVLLMDVRAVAVSLYKRIRQYNEYRLATHRLHHAFPSVHPPEDDPCSICFEPMKVAKQLPCGHVFHLTCLRAWLQQSGAHTFTCPNCRQPLLVHPPTANRPLGMIDRARIHLHLMFNRLALQALRILLEADQRAAQRQYARRTAQNATRRASGRNSIPAHQEPEGSGESSHPAPVSRFQKLLRRLRGSRRQPATASAPLQFHWPWRSLYHSLRANHEHRDDDDGRVEDEGEWEVERMIQSHGRPAAGQRNANAALLVAIAEEGFDLNDDDGITEGHESIDLQDISGDVGGVITHDAHHIRRQHHIIDSEGGADSQPAGGLRPAQRISSLLQTQIDQLQNSLEDQRHVSGSHGFQEVDQVVVNETANGRYLALGEPSRGARRQSTRLRSRRAGGAPSDAQQLQLGGSNQLVDAQIASGLQIETPVLSPANQDAHPEALQSPTLAYMLGGNDTRGRAGEVDRRAAAAQAARHLGVLSHEDVPTWSGGALQHVARRVRQTVRSSLALGDSRGAVAGWEGSHHHDGSHSHDIDDGEVCSRRRPVPLAMTR